ncbi:MAG: hypothetical protein HYY18_13340, partial [Planctomycetes bacterium]|nr:hypothetical protein [Planctomycetota bacterium]
FGPMTGPVATVNNPYSSPTDYTASKACAVSFVAGFNMASVYVNQSHRRAWHDTSGGWGSSGGGPRHPEYSYTSPTCFADGMTMTSNCLNSNPADTGYMSAYSSSFKPYQIEPTAAGIGWSWGGGGGGTGANFWDNGCDLQNFGVYINNVRRERFHTYWADELPSPDVTIEMTVKPEVDLWNWATRSKQHTVSGGWGSPYTIYPCSRQFLFEWGTGATTSNYAMNYRAACYVQLSRVYLEMYSAQEAKFYVMYVDHQWKPHTWHHVEVSWVAAYNALVGGTSVQVPHNAMLFADGVPCSGILSGDPLGPDVNTKLGMPVYPCKAMVLPFMVHPTSPNNDVGTGPRLDIGSCLANDGSFGMSQPRFHGLIDNIVMHHWRSHDAAFTPRNRYHSVSYYDGSTYKSGTGYKLEKAGVYKKRLTYLETECSTKDVTVGTLTCTHYHPFHVHLYGHDGSAPTTSFGHITPALRMKSGGSYVDAYYYDGCAGLPIKSKITPGSELYYMGWFEIASLVPVTMSPILCDITLTYFTEPVTYFRLSSAEAKK